MANKFFKSNQPSARAILERQYKDSRSSLLVVIIFTVLNVILALFNGDIVFLWSATIPHVIVALSMYFCGLYPPEAYEGVGTFPRLPREVFIVAIIAAVVIIGLYVLCYVMSKNNRGGWLTFALVLFGIDTFGMAIYYGFAFMSALDWVFHILVLFELDRGITDCKMLKTLPTEYTRPTMGSGVMSEIEPSRPLRIADMGAKCRVFHTAEENGKQIIYRKVGKTNELVINGYVYDEFTSRLMRPHTLTAVLNGRVIEAGTYYGGRSFVAVDGVIVATKIRVV